MKNYKLLQTLINKFGGDTTVKEATGIHNELLKYFPQRYSRQLTK